MKLRRKKNQQKHPPPVKKKNRTEQRLINIQYMHKSEFMQNHHRQLLKVLFVCIVSIIAYSKIILTTTSVYTSNFNKTQLYRKGTITIAENASYLYDKCLTKNKCKSIFLHH